MRVSRSEPSARDWIQRERSRTPAKAISSSRNGISFAIPLADLTNRSRSGPTFTPGMAGSHRLAGAIAGSSATRRGPVRRSYSGAIDTRQLPAACARSAGVYWTCTSFSASAIVAGVTSGPTAGPVPNAGGMPAGVSGTCGSAAARAAPGAMAAPARPSAECLRNRRRAMVMTADCLLGSRAVHAGLLMAVVLSMNAVSPPPAPACGLEVVRPETGPRRDGFMAWLATHAAELGGEVAARAAADSLGSFELRIADLDNDGAEDYVLTAHVGSGGYLDLYLFRRAGEGWALAQDSPLDQDPMVGANDYDDRASDQRQVLVRFCGRTFLTLLGGTAPNWSREAWMWKGGTFHRVCDADWLAEQRREFQRLFDLAQYDAAHGFLD